MKILLTCLMMFCSVPLCSPVFIHDLGDGLWSDGGSLWQEDKNGKFLYYLPEPISNHKKYKSDQIRTCEVVKAIVEEALIAAKKISYSSFTSRKLFLDQTSQKIKEHVGYLVKNNSELKKVFLFAGSYVKSLDMFIIELLDEMLQKKPNKNLKSKKRCALFIEDCINQFNEEFPEKLSEWCQKYLCVKCA